MTAKNNIPVGYKDSAVGIIPQEWEVKTLCECFYISAGRDLQKSFYSATPCGTQCYPIFSNWLENGGLYGYTSNPRHKAGCITITGRGMLGVAEYRKIDFDAIVRLLVLSPKFEIVGELIAEYINHKKPFYLESTGVPQLTAPQITNTPIPVPPMEEQRKIAEILGVWDEAIEKQSRLIERLELRKRALMQRHLTGRTRLPGFNTPWQKVKLGEICKRVTRRNEENNQNVMTISAQKGFVSQTDFFNKSVASSTLDNYYLVLKDEFCYNKSYSNGYPMGAIKRLKEADKAVVTTLYICFSIADGKRLDINFFEQFCESGGLNRGLMKVANEGGRAHGLLNATPTDFFSLGMLLPILPEQKAIAEVLTTADNEIATHRKKLDALHLQKRGLMQQLLTGKTRVKI